MPTLGGSALTPALSPRERKERAATWEKFEVAMAIGLVRTFFQVAPTDHRIQRSQERRMVHPLPGERAGVRADVFPTVIEKCCLNTNRKTGDSSAATCSM